MKVLERVRKNSIYLFAINLCMNIFLVLFVVLLIFYYRKNNFKLSIDINNSFFKYLAISFVFFILYIICFVLNLLLSFFLFKIITYDNLLHFNWYGVSAILSTLQLGLIVSIVNFFVSSNDIKLLIQKKEDLYPVK